MDSLPATDIERRNMSKPLSGLCGVAVEVHANDQDRRISYNFSSSLPVRATVRVTGRLCRVRFGLVTIENHDSGLAACASAGRQTG